MARTGLTRSAIRGLIGELVAADLVSEERAAPQGTPGPALPARPPEPERRRRPGARHRGRLARRRPGRPRRARLRPRTHRSAARAHVGRRHRRRPGRAGDPAPGPPADARPARSASASPSSASSGGATASCRWPRTSAGATSRSASGSPQALDTPAPIFVANDADLGALVEHRRGAAIGCDHVLFISGEYGVGGGLIIDGKPLTGVAGYGGEVGHIPVNPNGTACRCGSVGCWETEVGEAALLRLAGRAPGGGRGEVDAVLREAEAGSPAALSALDHVGRWLGVGLAGFVNLLNPQLVVLGGVFGRMHPFVARTLEEELDRRALAAPRRLVRIVPATLGADAPLLGAAELALEPLLADPAGWMGARDAQPIGRARDA